MVLRVFFCPPTSGALTADNPPSDDGKFATEVIGAGSHSPKHPCRHCQLIEADTVIRQTGTLPRPPCLLGGSLCTCNLGPTLESMAHFVTVCGG